LLAEEAATAPISSSDVERLNAVLGVAADAPKALADLTKLAGTGTALSSALSQFAARLDALADVDVDPSSLAFEASYGRTTLEYYSGFVFGFSAPENSILPVVATGGRYDMLTSALGSGASLPAVGGVIRPEGVLALKGGRA
jgi:ATP phosphoribosyltransferase regulatory subunit